MRRRRSMVALGFAVVCTLTAGGAAKASTPQGSPPVWTTKPLPPVISSAPPPASEDATNFQENSEHNGVAPGPALDPAHLRMLWSVKIPYVAGYPIVAGGDVFIIESINDTPTFRVRAFDGRTGRPLWTSNQINGNGFPVASLAYEDGYLFFAGEQNGVVAFDAETGAVDWNWKQAATDCNLVLGTIVSADHEVWLPESCQSAVIGHDERTGQIESGGGDIDYDGTPALQGNQMYTTATCPLAERTDIAREVIVWIDSGNCTGGEGRSTTTYLGEVWSPADRPYTSPGTVYSTVNGHLLGHYPGGAMPPVFDGNRAIAFYAGYGVVPTMISLNATTFATLWKQTEGGHLLGDAVASGHVVYMGDNRGYIDGFSTSTGQLVWQARAGSGVDIYGSGGVGYLNIGDGLLAAGGGPGLMVYGG
jgi:outer membrane protein assembly factor BamB